MKNTILTAVLSLAMALASGIGHAAAVACTDGMLTQAAFNGINGLTYDEVAAKIGCTGTAGTPILEPAGIHYITITPYFWQSPNKAYEVKFKNNIVESISNLSPSPTVPLIPPASFDAATNKLTIPVLVTGGVTYTNTQILLNPNGVWALTALSDANGANLPVTGQTTPQASIVTTGTIDNYVGVQANTIFTIGGQVWRGKTGCAMPAASINTTGPATTIGLIQPSPSATIYLIGSTQYVLTIVGTSLVCDVERLI